MSLKDFVPLDKLGYGSFASVYKVKRVSDQRIYALKKIKMGNLDSKAKNNALNYVRLLASINSPYIISYHYAFFDVALDALCIVMEYASGGDLAKSIGLYKQKHKMISELEIWKVLLHLLHGLSTLHNRSILHRDMKSENVFISEGIYKIGDMNVSKVNKTGLAKTQTGTPYYTSPYVWKDQPYGYKCDIWSIGCIIYEMAALRPPFSGNDMSQLYNSVTKGLFQPIPKCYSNELDSIIRQCLQVDPAQRPDVKELLYNFTIKMYANICIDFHVDYSQCKDLLKTINMPVNKGNLKQQLPKSNYKLTEIKESLEFFRKRSPNVKKGKSYNQNQTYCKKDYSICQKSPLKSAKWKSVCDKDQSNSNCPNAHHSNGTNRLECKIDKEENKKNASPIHNSRKSLHSSKASNKPIRSISPIIPRVEVTDFAYITPNKTYESVPERTESVVSNQYLPNEHPFDNILVYPNLVPGERALSKMALALYKANAIEIDPIPEQKWSKYKYNKKEIDLFPKRSSKSLPRTERKKTVTNPPNCSSYQKEKKVNRVLSVCKIERPLSAAEKPKPRQYYKAAVYQLYKNIMAMKKNLVTKQKQQGYSDRNAVGGAIFSRDALNQKILSLLGRNQLVFEQKPKHLKGIFC